jgi:hypothetical protein
MIRHTVVFRLKAQRLSNEEREFFKAAEGLGAIPGVANLSFFNQVNDKSPFDFCLSMEFASNADYQRYNEHPDHKKFVEDRWVVEVESFMELDYQPIVAKSS